jgi:prophage DNA circulation protein
VSDWRKQQGPASFRGVPFFVGSGERSGGRQSVVHEYPKSESPAFTEDLGIKSRTFNVDGYVLGTEYVSARDALLTELEKEGPGELVHPYFGTRRVVVTGYRVRESRDTGGIASFSIDFTETSSGATLPEVTKDPGAELKVAVSAAKASSSASFLSNFTATVRTSVTGALNSATAAAGQVLDRVAVESQNMAAMRRSLDGVTSTASALTAAPAGLLASMLSVIEGTGTALLTVPGLVDPSGLLLSLFDFDSGTRPPDTTPSRQVERASFDALNNLVKRLAIVESAAIVTNQTFTTFDDAVRVRNAIVSKLDEHTEAVSDDTYPSLNALRAALVSAVPGETSDLPRIQEFTPVASVPSLVLAHRLYGDLKSEADLVARNRIEDPSELLGGVTLEVLSRE